jgi:hypothetical protein
MWSFPLQSNHRRRRRRLEHNSIPAGVTLWQQNQTNEEALFPSNPSRVQIRTLPPDNVAPPMHDYPPIQRNLPEVTAESHSGIPSAAVPPYTVTYIILLAIGTAHIFRRRHRSRLPLTYRVLVVHKQWFRWWIAIFSLPSNVTEEAVLPRTHREHGSQHWMPGAWRSLWTTMVHHRQPRDAGVGELWRSAEYRQHLVVLYIGHLIWSCRGLEEFYRLPSSDAEEEHEGGGDAFTYLRVWLGLGLCVTLSEVLMLYWLLLLSAEVHRVLQQRATQRNQNARTEEGVSTAAVAQPTGEDTSASSTEDQNLQTLREWEAVLRSQQLTISVVKVISALLMVHRTRLSNVPIPPLPFLTSWMGPNVSYAASFWILFRLLAMSSTRSPSSSTSPSQPRDSSSAILRTMLHGTFIGLLWSHYLESIASAYWGNMLLLVGLVGTLLSFQAHSPRDVPCLNPVGCNARGRPLIYDASAQRWLSDSDDDEDHDDSNDIRVEGEDDDTASPASEEDNDDDFVNEMAQLIVPGVESSHVRSRRTASLPPGD